jgi:hypothetical protein
VPIAVTPTLLDLSSHLASAEKSPSPGKKISSRSAVKEQVVAGRKSAKKAPFFRRKKNNKHRKTKKTFF